MKATKIDIRFYLIIIFVIFQLFSIGQVTVFNSFGTGHNGWDYNFEYGDRIIGPYASTQHSSWEEAFSFQSNTNGTVSDIWVAISMIPLSTEADTVTIRLTSNPYGLPPDTSNIMEEWTLTEFQSNSQWNTPIHLTGKGTSKLLDGESYWLWALGKDTTWCIWCAGDPDIFALHALRIAGIWHIMGAGTSSAFRVDVDVSTDIPKISTKYYNNNLLFQNYPNPVYDNTYIEYSLGKSDYVNLKIFDIYGKEIHTLVNEFQNLGNHKVKFNASALITGIYLYSLEVGNKLIDIKKISKQHNPN